MSWLLLVLLPWLWSALVFAQMHPFPGPRVKASGAAAGNPVLTGTSSGPLTVSSGASGSGSVTVPADANMAICLVSQFSATAGRLSSGTVTLGGQAMTAITGGASNTAAYMGAVYYRMSPLTGTQTLAWTWSGVLDDTGGFWCVYYKGVNTSTPLRSSNCAQSTANPHRSATLTVVSGDTAVGLTYSYSVAESTYTFLTAAGDLVMTKRQDLTRSGTADGAWADATPAANGTIAADNSTDNLDGGICGLILRP
jgi:hypothetical protein